MLRLKIPTGKGVVAVRSGLVSGYSFTVLLLKGAPAEDGLEVEVLRSPLFTIGGAFDKWEAEMEVPGVPWMLCGKVVCCEGDEEAPSPGLKG